MTLIPFIFCDWDDLVCRSLLDQNFNLEVRRPERLSLPGETVGCLRPQRNHDLDELRDLLNLSTRPRRYEGPSALTVNKDDFQMVLDVQHFMPEEIEVKIVNDHLVVTAKHEDKKDEHGWVSRQFTRRYQLPKDVDVEHLTSKLSSDGLLMIVAPKKQPLKDETERTLRIKCTGKPFVNKKLETPKTLDQSEKKKPE